MSKIVELTPITPRGRDVLDRFASQTGQLPFKTVEASGAKTYYVRGKMNLGRFKAALDQVEPNWERHLALKDVTPTE